MILYHFPTSPVARRVRLALALKSVTAELRDARAVPEHRAEVIPGRAQHFPPAAQVVSLGWSIPAALTTWTDQHRTRADIAALG